MKMVSQEEQMRLDLMNTQDIAQHRRVQALENNNTEVAGGNDFDVDNVEGTIDAPTAREK